MRYLVARVLFGLTLVAIPGQWVHASIELVLPSAPVTPRRTIGGGSLEEREQALRARIEEFGPRPAFVHELGRILFRQGRSAEAIERWNDAANRDANLPPSEVAIVQELRVHGDLDAAESELNKLLSTKDGPHAQIEKGHLALARNDRAQAKGAFGQAFRLSPELYATNLTLARFYDLVREPKKAAKLYRRATQLAPERAEGWVFLAARHFDDGEIDESLKMLAQAETCDEFQQPAEIRLAELYRASNALVDARRWYLAGLKREPNDAFSRYRLGEIAMYFKRTDEARAHFQAVINGAEVLPALVALGQLEQSVGNWDQATRYYRRAIELDPKNVVANNNLAMVLVQSSGPAEEALLRINVAREVSDSPIIQNTYGCVLWLAGRHKEARDALEPTLRHVPSDAWTRYVYANVLQELGEKEEARVHFDGCLLIDPIFPHREQIEKDLAAERPDKS